MMLEGWMTVIPCPKCKHKYIYSDGRNQWCEACGYNTAQRTTIKWSDEDKKFLIENYAKLPAAELSAKLKRTRTQITSYARWLRKKGYNIPNKPRRGRNSA